MTEQTNTTESTVTTAAEANRVVLSPDSVNKSGIACFTNDYVNSQCIAAVKNNSAAVVMLDCQHKDNPVFLAKISWHTVGTKVTIANKLLAGIDPKTVLNPHTNSQNSGEKTDSQTRTAAKNMSIEFDLLNKSAVVLLGEYGESKLRVTVTARIIDNSVMLDSVSDLKIAVLFYQKRLSELCANPLKVIESAIETVGGIPVERGWQYNGFVSRAESAKIAADEYIASLVKSADYMKLGEFAAMIAADKNPFAAIPSGVKSTWLNLFEQPEQTPAVETVIEQIESNSKKNSRKNAAK
jgi:hypothetical protein